MQPSFPRLARLFGVALSNIEESHILTLVSAGASEGEDLEFKGAMYGPGDKAELAKDASALANSHGGLLLIGIAESQGIAVRHSPVEVDESSLLFLRSVLLDRVHPMLTFRISVVPSAREPGKSYVLIFVTPSPLAPHAVSKPNQESLRYALRVGTQTRWLAESEVANLYRSRFEMAHSQVDRLGAVMTEGLQQLELGRNGSMRPWLALAIVPAVSGDMAINARTPRRLEEWSYARPTVWPDGGAPFPRVRSGVGIGRVVLREHYDQATRKTSGFHAELFRSGASFTACQLPEPVDRPIADEVLAWLCACMVDLAAGHAVENCGCFGDGVVGIQLVEPERFEPTVSLSMRLGRMWGKTGTLQPLGPIALDRGPSTTQTVDLSAAVGSPQEVVMITRMMLTDLVQAFGVPEPHQISGDGEIRTQHFSEALQRDVASTAGVIGLATTDEYLA